MKKYCFLFYMISILISCNNDTNRAKLDKSLKEEAMAVAIKYASSKFSTTKQNIEKDGIVLIQEEKVNFVTLGENGLKYIIDPAKIIIGLINSDNDQDAIITISSVKDQYLQIPEILIMTRIEGHFILNRAIESDMKVLGIKNRLIIAEISTKSRNSPLRNCSACKEIVKYQFINGELVKAE
jgi:hypothetical protein